MPWWLLVDVAQGCVYLVAVVMLVVFLVAWIHWIIKPVLAKRRIHREWQSQFVADMLQENSARIAALPQDVGWDEQLRGPKWNGGESFKAYQTRWADWYVTERNV